MSSCNKYTSNQATTSWIATKKLKFLTHYFKKNKKNEMNVRDNKWNVLIRYNNFHIVKGKTVKPWHI